ncbi:hypothetical protein Q8F55_006569 [Vanrija albida]|uniref:Mitochondrial carrier protein n=1 Tax=Vanrija albida TaxID=181172 RepID=A0ABR3PXK8_9TREE
MTGDGEGDGPRAPSAGVGAVGLQLSAPGFTARFMGPAAPPTAQHDRREPVALPPAEARTSAGAAFTRSLLLFMGFLFRRPSKLFRPNRLDTWAGLRQLAESADQNLSPTFVRNILKTKGGPAILGITLLPPLIVNTTLGFLLFSSHSLLSLWLARLPFFHRREVVEEESTVSIFPDFFTLDDGEDGLPIAEEEEITLETIIRGPRNVPRHPTLCSALAGAGAGVIQGLAFTPIENVVRFLQQSTTSLTSLVARFLHLPGLSPEVAAALGPQPKHPLEAFRNLVASSTWAKDHSWWTGWRWAIARDAVSYSIFFATFDLTRRVALRVKAIVTASVEKEKGIIEVAKCAKAAPGELPARAPSETPTKARLAQAFTIVAGGVAAASAAELAGRPFRAGQRYSGLAAAERQRLSKAGKPIPWRYEHPIRYAWQKHGMRAYFHREGVHETPKTAATHGNRFVRALTRVGWRLASVGPWGFGFLVFAWIGGEV